MILPHNTFAFVFPAPLPPPPKRRRKKKKKTHSILLLLNYMTSSRPGTKSRGNMHIEHELSTKLFIMYIYANDILDYSRKSQSLLLLLPFGQSICLAICTESGSGQSPWLVLYKNYLKGKLRFHCSSVTLLKVWEIREWWILQSLANIIYIPVSMLMNFGCLRLRWTALSRLSPSSSFIPLYLIFSTLNIK